MPPPSPFPWALSPCLKAVQRKLIEHSSEIEIEAVSLQLQAQITLVLAIPPPATFLLERSRGGFYLLPPTWSSDSAAAEHINSRLPQLERNGVASAHSSNILSQPAHKLLDSLLFPRPLTFCRCHGKPAFEPA